jgi:hypothetical protein
LRRVIVFGGYGVFGSQVARLLSAWGTPVTIAGRDRRRAEAFARSLSGDRSAAAVDVTLPDSCRSVLAGHNVAVNCAGPFRCLGTALLEACLHAGCHYVDITDDRGYAALVRSFGARFTERRLVAVFGCSSLPGISGALALHARKDLEAPVERVRVTLAIGNNNPKGQAAVHSLLAGVGRPIAAPQGTLFGFRHREVVTLPAPFGRRGVFTFESPEYDLFASLLGAHAVSVHVAFELRVVQYAIALLAWLGSGYGRLTARALDLPGRALGWLGCSGGAVMSELFFSDGSVRWAALVARRDGQRMAALPCALVARGLSVGDTYIQGAVTAYEFLGAATLLGKLVEEGFELHGQEWQSSPPVDTSRSIG